MPTLDRRIVVRIAKTGTNQFGEPATTTTDLSVWATLLQDRLARNIGTEGAYALADRVWRVRFNQAFADAHAAGAEISVVYGAGEPDIVTGMGEPARRMNRRQYLDLLS